MLVKDAFLAKLTSTIGTFDAVTSILTSFVMLGCGFQFIEIFLVNKRLVRPYVTLLHSINELCLALIYCVPLSKHRETERRYCLYCFCLVDIQNNGNTFLDMQVYAQQVVAVISLILNILLSVYLNTVVRKIRRKDDKEEKEF